MRIDPLLTNYPIRIRQVTLGVFIGISSIFYIFPRALGEAEKTNYIIKDEIETFDIPQTEQIEIPEPPAKPSVPIASEDDFLDEDYDIFDTDFDDWGDWEAPPSDEGGDVEFVAFDKAPKAIITIQENVDPSRISIIKGLPALNEAAIAAVKKSKWKPAQQRDMRVGVYQTIPIKFELK